MSASAASPNPNNLILLAVLGIGAYWIFSRNAMAQPVQIRPGTRPQQGNTGSNLNGAANLLNAGAGLVRGLFGGGSTAPKINTRTPYYSGQLTQPQYAAASQAAQADSNPDTNGSYADWVRDDGIALNPPGNVSAYDAWVEDVYYN